MVEGWNLGWFGRFCGLLIFQFVSLVCDFALVRVFGISQTPSLVESPKILTSAKATPPPLRLFVMLFLLDSANKRKNTESALDSAKLPYLVDLSLKGKGDSSFCKSKKKQKLLKELCEAPKNSPASWCKKSDSKGAVVPPADFLLEADKRGSPPKSEKAAAFWRVGGAGWGGGAALFAKRIK